jgi:hypothetical protein
MQDFSRSGTIDTQLMITENNAMETILDTMVGYEYELFFLTI